MQRIIVTAALLLTAHVAAARGITANELIGTWIMGAAGADTVYGTFRSDFTYSITHSHRPWARGTWKLSSDGKKLSMINAVSGEGEITVVRRLDGRVLHLTGREGEFTWKRAQERGHSQSSKRPNQAMQRTASKVATDAVSVCHPRVHCVESHSGLAVADLVSR